MGKKSKKKKEKAIQKRDVSYKITNEINDINEVEEDLARIMAILCVDNEEDMEVTDQTLAKYFSYLNENIDFSGVVTGIEDFTWEEFYVIGPGDRKEYEKLKKSRPSYTDKYDIISLYDYDLDYGIFVNVRRIADKKRFTLPLADLKAVEKDSNNFRLLDDYSIWFVNYR